MWANSTSTLKGHPTEETGPEDKGQGTAPEGQPSMGTSTAPGMSPRWGGIRRFRWSPDAIRRLDGDIDWALTSNPTGAAELVGILLGKIGPTIEITDCQPLFLMQPSDRAHALAGPGKDEFERTLAAFQSIPEGQRSVIGFYRSQAGDELDLTEEDRVLVRTCFRDASPVVLLIQRTANGPSSAKLFVGDRGDTLCQFHSSESASVLEGPSALPRWLDLWHSLSADNAASAVLDTIGPDTTKPTQATEPANPVIEYAPILATEEAQQNSIPLERRLNRPVFLLAATVILAIFTGYLMLRGSAKVKDGVGNPGLAAHGLQSGSSHSAGLALRAERHGDDLRLDWDHNAPVLVAATGGMLTIREGNGPEKQVMLDGNLLRRGAMVYRPVHGDVSLRLVIFGQEGTKMGESISSYPQQTPVNGSDRYKEKQ